MISDELIGGAKVVDIRGGHVGAVVGSKAVSVMYPALIEWLAPRLAAGTKQRDPARQTTRSHLQGE